MGVINASQYGKTTSNPIGRLLDWLGSLFGHSNPPATPAAHGPAEVEMSDDFGHDAQTGESNLMEFGWDKTGGWDKRKKGGWSPHGDGGMR